MRKDTERLFNYPSVRDVTKVEGITLTGNIILIDDHERLEKAKTDKEHNASFFVPKDPQEIENVFALITNKLEEGYNLLKQYTGENNNMILSLVTIPSLANRTFAISSSLIAFSQKEYYEMVKSLKANLETEEYKVSLSKNKTDSALYLKRVESFKEKKKDIEVVDIVEVPFHLHNEACNAGTSDRFYQDFLENLEKVTVLTFTLQGKAKPTEPEGVA